MRYLRLLQVPAVLALFAFLLSRTDLDGMHDALSGADPSPIALAVALNLPIALLFGVRSRFVLGAMGYRPPADVVFPAAVLGNVAGALTPASAGEVLRAAALRTRGDVAARDGFALVLFERGLSLYLMALGTAVAVAWAGLPSALALAVTAVGVALLAAPVVLAPLLRIVADGTRGVGFVTDGRRCAGRLAALLRDVGLVARWSGVTAAIFAVTAVQYWLIARSVADGVNVGDAWIALGVSQLAGIASLLPLGLGAADGSLATVLRRAGLTFEEGASVAVLVRAASTLPLILLALASYLWLLRERRAAPAAEAPDAAAADRLAPR